MKLMRVPLLLPSIIWAMVINSFGANCLQYVGFAAPAMYSGNSPFRGRNQIFVLMFFEFF